MNMEQVVVDSREPETIKDYFKGLGATISALGAGDFIIKDKDDPDISLLVIERKTLSDLNSSLLDGRFKEQRERLLECGCKIIYIIEEMHKLHEYDHPRMLLGPLENLVLYYDIFVLYSQNIHQTIDIVTNLVQKVTEKDQPKKRGKLPQSRKCKQADSTFEKQLLLIPGVSVPIAKAVISHFANAKELILAQEENQDILVNLVISDKRKITKKLSDKIYDAYHG